MNIRISGGLVPALGLAVLLGGGAPGGGVAAQIAGPVGVPDREEPAPQLPEPSVEARIWLDRGADPVVQRGDRVRVYYRTSEGAYVTIFHVDTNGTVSLVFPQTPESRYFVEGGRDYRLLFPPNSSWFVEDDPGVGYFFILASPDPMEFGDFPYSWQSRSWDLSFVGQAVYEDPFVAMDEYIARLIPDWEYADYTLDWVEYSVGERHEYPRFLCYDCHGFTPYAAWNPYLSACTSFRVVIYDDPWYYPVNRYRGNAVVYVRPDIWRQPRFAFRERVAGEPWAPLVRPRPAPGGPGLPGSVAPRRTGAGIGSGGTTRVYPAPGRRGGSAAPGAVRPGVRSRPTQIRDRRDPAASARPTVERRGTVRPGNPSAGKGVPRTGRPGVSPGRTGAGSRPGVTPSAPTRRPTGRVIIPRGGTRGDALPGKGSGSSGTVRPSRPSAGSSGRPPARVSPPARSGGSGRVIRVRPRGSGSGGAVRRPPARSSGGAAVRSRPPARPSGGAVRRAPARSSGSGAVRSAPARSSRSGSARRSPPARVRSSGGGAQRRAPPRRPPPRRRAGGGGAPPV